MTFSAESVDELWVVMPAYNEEAGILATLKALAAQRDQNFTLLIVNNNSTDRTAEVVRDFAAAQPVLRLELITEKEKGTGTAADTGMRYAASCRARFLARTDADCIPAPDWTEKIRAGFDDGLTLIAGRLTPRLDEGLSRWQRTVLRTAVSVATVFGRFRPGNRDRKALGPYVMAAGCNMAITADLYLRAGGFPRTRIEDLHEDRALVNAVRRLTPAYGARRDMLVFSSSRRVRAWGLRNTLAWYADHRYRPEQVDIR